VIEVTNAPQMRSDRRRKPDAAQFDGADERAKNAPGERRKPDASALHGVDEDAKVDARAQLPPLSGLLRIDHPALA
jgi:hypothetical protein